MFQKQNEKRNQLRGGNMAGIKTFSEWMNEAMAIGTDAKMGGSKGYFTAGAPGMSKKQSKKKSKKK